MYDWKIEFKKLVYNKFVDIDKIKKLIFENKPQSLYKYKAMSMDMGVSDLYNLQNCIKNNTIWCSSPDYFNDPYDSALFIKSHSILENATKKVLNNDTKNILENIYLKEIKDKFYGKEINLNDIEDYITEILNYLNIDLNSLDDDQDINLSKKDLFTILFNIVNDNFQIEKAYKSGIDVEVIEELIAKCEKDIDNIFQSNFNSIRDSLAITCLSETNDNILMWSHYANNHKGICLEYDFEEINTKYNIFPVIYSNNICDISNDILNDNYNFIIQKVLTKAEDWKYENEWRIVVKNKNESQTGTLIKIPKVKAIYMGCRIDEKNQKAIEELAIENGIEIYKMEMSTNEFKLIPKKIEVTV